MNIRKFRLSIIRSNKKVRNNSDQRKMAWLYNYMYSNPKAVAPDDISKAFMSSEYRKKWKIPKDVII